MSRFENIATTCVSWDHCTLLKKVGDLNLTSPQDAMGAFVSKWIIQALLSRPIKHASFLEVLYSHNWCHGSWDQPFFWLFSPNFSIKGNSKVWHHIASSWEMVAHIVAYLSLSILEDIFQFNLWWKVEYHGLYFGITKGGIFILYRKCLRYLGLWKEWLLGVAWSKH